MGSQRGVRVCGTMLPVGDRDAERLFDFDCQRQSGRLAKAGSLFLNKKEAHELDRTSKPLSDGAATSVLLNRLGESLHLESETTTSNCTCQTKFARTQMDSTSLVGESGPMNTNRSVHEFREAMYRAHIKQGQLADRLEKLLGKPYKRGEAAVSAQLKGKLLSKKMAPWYWRALDELTGHQQQEQPPHLSLVQTAPSGNDFADAVRLLMHCTPEQLTKATSYIAGLLESPAQRR